MKKDPTKCPIRGRLEKCIVGTVPIVEIIEIDGCRTFALHRDFFMPSFWTVSEIKTGGHIASGKSKRAARDNAAAKCAAVSDLHGSLKRALAYGYQRLKKDAATV